MLGHWRAELREDRVLNDFALRPLRSVHPPPLRPSSSPLQERERERDPYSCVMERRVGRRKSRLLHYARASTIFDELGSCIFGMAYCGEPNNQSAALRLPRTRARVGAFDCYFYRTAIAI